MAQINLLKQNQGSGLGGLEITGILSKLAAFLLLFLAVFYAWKFFQSKSAEKQISSLESQILKQKQELSEIKGRDEVFTRQAQLKGFDSLISGHAYWSQLLPELAKVTLKKASYLSFRAENQGSINLAVQLPTMTELDKFLQIFDSAKINKYFTDLRMSGISKVVEKDQDYLRVDIRLKYNLELLKYKSP